MAIVGLGLDLVETERVRRVLTRFGERFARHILAPGEIFPGSDLIYRESGSERRICPVQLALHMAARFAAKEAGVKALGTGFRGKITPPCLEVVSCSSGQPQLVLHGAAREEADRLGVRRVHLSLSHCRDSAAAVVILED